MIDSFEEAVRCAEEALRDPGGLRYAHLPSLVAFVSGLRAGSAVDTEWDPAELARGVQLNRLLWELGLRGEANELFTELAERLRGASPRNAGGTELANALASVGVRLGRLDEARAVLVRLVDSVASGSAGAKYRADMTPAARTAPGGVLGLVTWINLAAVELALGDTTSAALRAGLARIWLAGTGLRDTAEVEELLAGVELRLAAGSLPRGDTAPDRPPYRHEGLRRDSGDEARRTRRAGALDQLSRSAGELVRELDGGPRAFLTVAGLAVAQLAEALDGDPGSVATAVGVLEIACQRLSAMLGADHPEVLGVLADLAAARAEAARVARSPARLEQAVAQLASVSRRLEFRLGAGHPRSVAALANLATARVESVRMTAEPGKAARTAQVLDQQARQTSQLLGNDHPVARLVRASSTTCHRMAVGEDWGSEGSTLLKTLVDAPQDWDTEDSAYRSFAQATRRLGGGSREAARRRRRARAVRRGFSTEGRVASQAFGGVLPVAGDIVLGFVVEVGLSRVLLSLAGGTVGMVPADELSVRPDTDPREICAVGEVMEAVVLHRKDPGRPDGPVLSARRAHSWRAWSDLERIKEKGGAVSGTVLGRVKGGLVVDVGLRAFLPDGLLDTGQGIGPSGPSGRRRALGRHEHGGATVRAKIVALDREHHTVVLSHRAWREDRPSGPREVRRGQIRSGVVTEVVEFGAFVRLGGVVGLLHRSELSWTRIGHPSEVVEPGQEITVEIIGVVLDAEGRERVSLSLKRVHDGPWQRFVCAHRPGEIVEGEVTRLTPAGALVRVDEGIEGLIRPGEFPGRGEADPGQDVEVGEDLFVKINNIDFARHRTSFSLRRADDFLGDDPARAMFEPVRYGMAAFCDDRGTLTPPDGFDEEAGLWLPGYEEQREHFERRLEAAEARFRRHRAWAVRRRGGTPPP
ncbi:MULTISPECIES: S1 RNA-binding domain-containing protein [Streptomyces]|uniref:S1 RNA-binding domain-containing protein n=1 Tax=Streptomyces TaxID=1883 RepID=UPI0006EB7619|nr:MULTISPECIES: S1 RNA-binding domain-containing protein [Streptomyces]MCP3767325.1 S1 RNA-binding domain-containing protein [Streptomyces sp. MAR25Y5]